MIVGIFGVTFAADGVNMQVRILERKSTDTINDFPIPSTGIVPQVLGASIDKSKMCLRKDDDIPVPMWKKIIDIFHF